MSLNTRRPFGRGILAAALAAGFIVRPPALATVFPDGRGTSYAQSGPAVSLDRDRLRFGDQVVGEESPPRRVTATNTGGTTLYINSVEVRGGDWKDFRVVKDTCTGNAIAPGRSCVVDVSFTPSETGDRAARLVITDNAADGPHKLMLTGTGINSVDVPPFGGD